MKFLFVISILFLCPLSWAAERDCRPTAKTCTLKYNADLYNLIMAIGDSGIKAGEFKEFLVDVYTHDRGILICQSVSAESAVATLLGWAEDLGVQATPPQIEDAHTYFNQRTDYYGCQNVSENIFEIYFESTQSPKINLRIRALK